MSASAAVDSVQEQLAAASLGGDASAAGGASPQADGELLLDPLAAEDESDDDFQYEEVEVPER